jgi:MinD-like ATPase involved in chromosome partitioning or flagellar assembly
MYVVTFYSFKGGVGRTMALANIAYELAQSGQRVLVVDFDLEAPGLDTLDFGAKLSSTRGIVDYVTEFKSNRRAPSVVEFVFDVGKVGDGHLWVMPSGLDDGRYSSRLAQINWAELYERHDGYLMFEDMKEQWREEFAPDYVLIDSRTGYTDVAGICTRQLPDAVVALFVPNEQNLRGLQRVVSEVRDEAQTARGKLIALHFVMSNVPDLDDEEAILERQIKRFRQQLGVRDFFIVNRYDSLSLLNQSLFTKDRPRSRLAKQYRGLSDRIRRLNPLDALGALKFLSELSRRPASVEGRVAERQIERIRDTHRSNGEVLTALAEVLLRRGQTAEALESLERASDSGYRSAKLFLQLAEARLRLGQKGGLAAAELVVEQRDADEFMLLRALEIFRQSGVEGTSSIDRLAESPALASLEADRRLLVADELNMSIAELRVARRIYESFLSTATRSRENDRILASSNADLCAIGLSEFGRAIELISSRRKPTRSLPINDQFNLSMAMWGRDGLPTRAEFTRVVEISKGQADLSGPNFHQCLAVAAHFGGDRSLALQHLALSRTGISEAVRAEVSCWRYLRVKPTEFRDDLDCIEDLINGKSVQPLFMDDR